jgi:flagellar hook protein FlgE
VVAQLALASIRNPGSLMAVGSNNYEASADTALPAIGVANTGGRGEISGGSLESSTVDIAKEFTNLIVLQRAYQANGKVITAGDQLSQDTIALMR